MALFESEQKIMNIIWRNEGIKASDIYRILKDSTGWARNTAYTIITRCIDKGYIRREDPGFRCFSLVSLEEEQKSKVQELISNLYDNSVFNFLSAFTASHKLSKNEKKELKRMIDKME